AVLGVEDELLGRRLVAVAVPLGREASESAILALCLARLPRHKLPAEIRLVAALPKYASSKIDRGSCLALFNKNSGTREAVAAGSRPAGAASSPSTEGKEGNLL
ncbi:MAG TPA: hypothetical protein VIK40_04300, partial [Geomonas sp.]